MGTVARVAFRDYEKNVGFMSMSYDYSDRRKRKEPTAAKRRRGERPAVPLDQRPENRRSVPRAVNVRAWLVWLIGALVLFAVLALVVVR